ncbi:uncharacterized protein DEA37_0012680 [Paragonimus westermani]|uniref:Reverse transcriptase domain-containing protein n=1 Tax=Paragonimus westermani TaxID=34504 RepID=A0A5J4NZR0_9TREM|nr:uncharacterized protein DEA37_0012680 [Paragonimus westermani]
MDWNCGTITSIFRGDRSDVSNYRPVTLLPVISKVLERLVANKLTKHLEGNNILSIAQHGFRKSHSCLSNLLLTLDDWTLAIDNGNPIHACYLDMSKAFDRVNHSILLQKLKQHGVTGKLLAWLENYLMDRVIQVRVDGALSKPVAVTSGVPQGSVLGPTLFLIYANDIPNLVRCKIILFADDIKLWATAVSPSHMAHHMSKCLVKVTPTIPTTCARPHNHRPKAPFHVRTHARVRPSAHSDSWTATMFTADEKYLAVTVTVQAAFHIGLRAESITVSHRSIKVFKGAASNARIPR